MKYSSLFAPQWYNKYNHRINTSNLVMQVIKLATGGSFPVTVRISHLTWSGWTGMTCQYGGVSLINRFAEFGPYCNRYIPAEVNIISGRELHVQEGNTLCMDIHHTFQYIW